ncbi:GAF domain-containing protein [Mucilaginibacter polytrichastri]|uniref:GAF domain-containing protein n=1 Tax=Mucilaginibacter polytrichastri TaxID=1302689 RepID=A0A1Q5ZT35_9SPHI|nr:GAF domain-containing protein [Mucilaginibacter polytrichastri]OKS84926.1 hypothetical protein RG47T_0364 [Mucilaginibacter polytrichastri]SFS47522.1 PAS domain S-box-containing protein [Mucilaginibacter polytrichastri]
MPHQETQRLQAVHRFLNLKFSKEKELKEIIRLAATICGTPTALLTLIDKDTQYIKFRQAFDFETTLRKDAFCNHVIEQDEVIVVPDAKLDSRFVNNPLVNNDPNIRFYAGAPLVTNDGHRLGSLCVINQIPGQLTENQQLMLMILAKQAMQLMDFDESLNLLKEQFNEAKRSEIELRSFFESSMDHHLLLGRNFEILAFNKAWGNHVINAYGRQMEKGKPMIDYIHPDNLHLFYKDYQTALKGTAVYDERNLGQSRNNWRLVKFEPAFNPAGEIIGVSVNTADVNKRIEHENTVKAQTEQLNEIAFIQSHELRKPVASILGLMDLIRMDGRNEGMEEWLMLEKAVQELDDKIRMIIKVI